MPAIALLLLAAAAGEPAAPQAIGGRAFESFARSAAMTCPGEGLRGLSPSALLDFEDDFLDRPQRTQTRRLAKALIAERCPSDEGAECLAAAQLAAIERTRLLREFTRAACGHWSR
ncbi:MAG: hypothetical protein JF593_13820 [Novosphingobium sp.]|nr:hypothetical protein [Novosphingobium sp.]